MVLLFCFSYNWENMKINDLGECSEFLLDLGVGGVKVLHEAEKRELIEEDLRQVDE